jgi:hypothetical protein
MTAGSDESPAVCEARAADGSEPATRTTDSRLRLVVDDPGDDLPISMERLAGAFDRVRSIRDWQAPICAEIAAEDRAVVEQAVIWFTATVPTFDPVPGAADRLSVKAAGYRRGPWGAPRPVALVDEDQ